MERIKTNIEWIGQRTVPFVMLSYAFFAVPGFAFKVFKNPAILSSLEQSKDTLFAQMWLLMGNTVDKIFRPHKAELLHQHVEGKYVVDLGSGTGHNMAYLDKSKIGHLICIEPNVDLHPALIKKAESYGFINGENLTICGFGAEDFDKFREKTKLGKGDVDCVVSVLALCSIPDYTVVIHALYDLLKPGGKFIFFEHVLSKDPGTRRFQDRMNSFWRFSFGGCELNRDTDKQILDNFEWADKKVWNIPTESKYDFSTKAIGWAQK